MGILKGHGGSGCRKSRLQGRPAATSAFQELSAEEKAELVKEQPAYGRVICRCETVTEGEILARPSQRSARHHPSDGVKRRAGAGMGRCQGGFCGPRVHGAASAQELGVRPS